MRSMYCCDGAHAVYYAAAAAGLDEQDVVTEIVAAENADVGDDSVLDAAGACHKIVSKPVPVVAATSHCVALG